MELLTVTVVAAVLGENVEQTLRKMDGGQIRTLQVNRSQRVCWDALADYLQGRDGVSRQTALRRIADVVYANNGEAS